MVVSAGGGLLPLTFKAEFIERFYGLLVLFFISLCKENSNKTNTGRNLRLLAAFKERFYGSFVLFFFISKSFLNW